MDWLSLSDVPSVTRLCREENAEEGIRLEVGESRRRTENNEEEELRGEESQRNNWIRRNAAERLFDRWAVSVA